MYNDPLRRMIRLCVAVYTCTPAFHIARSAIHLVQSPLPLVVLASSFDAQISGTMSPAPSTRHHLLVVQILLISTQQSACDRKPRRTHSPSIQQAQVHIPRDPTRRLEPTHKSARAGVSHNVKTHGTRYWSGMRLKFTAWARGQTFQFEMRAATGMLVVSNGLGNGRTVVHLRSLLVVKNEEKRNRTYVTEFLLYSFRVFTLHKAHCAHEYRQLEGIRNAEECRVRAYTDWSPDNDERRHDNERRDSQ